jgi:protein-disulfide isomerase
MLKTIFALSLVPALACATPALSQALHVGTVAIVPQVSVSQDPVAAAGFIDPLDGILGNPNADVSVVAFIDRASAPSAASIPILVALAAGDPGVRIIIKELPLLSKASIEAAEVAVAARLQGTRAFVGFEIAMMKQGGPSDGLKATQAAASAGLDMVKLTQDLESHADPDYLLRTRAQAMALGVKGTPTFLVGDRALIGVQALSTLRAAVEEQRAQKTSDASQYP